MDSLRIIRQAVQDAIEDGINNLCKTNALKFNGQTKKTMSLQDFELKILKNPSITLSKENYKLSEDVAFCGKGVFVFKNKDGDSIEFGENDYSFSGSACLMLDGDKITATIVGNTVTISQKFK